MQKIEEADLFKCRFYSSELGLLEQQQRTLDQQEQTIRITEAWINERRSSLQQRLQKLTPKLDELGEMLVQKYGIEDQNQINWETGEIRPAPQAAAQSGDPCVVADTSSGSPPAGVDFSGDHEPKAADPPGAKTPDQGGAGNSGSPAE